MKGTTMSGNQKETEEMTESTLAYTTTTGDEPKSNLASIAADKEAPVHQAVTPKRIAKKVTKKRRPRTSAPAVTHTDIKVDKRVMAVAKKVQAQGVYTKLQIIDHETVVVR